MIAESQKNILKQLSDRVDSETIIFSSIMQIADLSKKLCENSRKKKIIVVF